MVAIGKKRIFGLIGPQRSGKDTVAKYLEETRGFTTLAFADRIKEEFGISKEEFEAAKIAGNIEELRQKLWDFSAKIKEKDPLHFINGVMEKARTSSSVVITDIRTADELSAFYTSNRTSDVIRRVYLVFREQSRQICDILDGSQLPMSLILKHKQSKTEQLRVIHNDTRGVYQFYQELDKFFFLEDVSDLLSDDTERDMVIEYLMQYDVKASKKGLI